MGGKLNFRLEIDSSQFPLIWLFLTHAHAEQWVWDGAQYVGRTGIFGRLTKNGDSSFDLVQKDHTRYHFAPDGTLAWAEDNNANRTALAYDGSGRLTTVTAPDGRALTLAYSGDRLSQVTDPGGRTVQFGQNGSGDLTAITDVRNRTTTAAHDSNHRLLTMTDANAHTFVTNIFDSAGRVAEQRDGGNKWTFVYSDADHLTIVTDPLNHATTYTYDGDGRLLSEKNALNQTESYAYDAAGNRSQMTDRRGNISSYTYDSRGNLLTAADPLSFSRAYAYDADDNLLTETDARGGVTTYTYSATHNLTNRRDALNKVTTFTYTAQGLLATMTDPLGRTTIYAYNTNGDQTSTTDALGGVSSATYDNLGRMLTATNPLSRTITYTYDAANHPLTMTNALGGVTSTTYDNVGNPLTVTDPRGGVTTTAYDNRDKVAAETNALGQTVSYTYDAVGNLTVITDPLGHTTTYDYDALDRRTSVKNALNQTTTYAYDAVGNNTGVTDARSKTTTYLYDARNLMTRVTDAAGGMVNYLYDGNGNRTRMTDANNHVTNYAYDALNRLNSVTDPLNNVIGYSYDDNGNRTSKTKADGTVITYGFDALNRLTAVTAPGIAIAYTYDANGNRLSMTDATGATSYTYDNLDRVTQVTSPVSLHPTADINQSCGVDTVDQAIVQAAFGTIPGDPNWNAAADLNENGTIDIFDNNLVIAHFGETCGANVLAYSYDANGNRTGLTYPDGRNVAYSYDSMNRLLTATDWDGRATGYTYDAAGRQTSINYPNGVTAAYGYDTADRLQSLAHTHPSLGTVAGFTYTVDAVGNRTQMIDGDGTTSYTYDNLNRLTRVIYPGGETVDYTYDPMGNRLSLTSTVSDATSYTYDAANRLLTAGATAFNWDVNGNMTARGAAGYTWDTLDRLVSLDTGSAVTQYTYNGDGVRVRKQTDGIQTVYVQDVTAPLPMVLAEENAGHINRYVLGNDLILSTNTIATPSFYHPDGLGSTRALSDAARGRTDWYSYDVFGATRSHIGTSGQDFTFTGEQVDDESGLVFLRARYYDAGVGRFISEDDYPSLFGDTQTMNRLIYVQNNPIALKDSSGNAWYDFLDVEKNGINAAVRKYVVPHTPVVKDLVSSAEGMDRYAQARRENFDLITPYMTEEDQVRFDENERIQMAGLEQGLSSATNALMNTPGTSLNMSVGLTDFLPGPLGSAYSFFKNPWKWGVGKIVGSFEDPSRGLPAAAIRNQFRQNYNSGGSVLGMSTWNYSRMGQPASAPKYQSGGGGSW